MKTFNKEYFNDYCYFNINVVGNKINLSYSVYETLSESKGERKKIEIDKKNFGELKKIINKYVKLNKKTSKKTIEKDLKNLELDEYVDSDGTMLTSKTPIYDMKNHPRKTMDQTIAATRISNDPITRGPRVYYGENKETNDDVISEIDFSDTFGWDETKDKDFKDTVKTFKQMGIEDPVERVDRAKKFGKLPNQKVRKTKNGKKVLKQRLTEKEYLEEIKKQRMIKMVEDLLAKKGDDHEIMEKDIPEDGLNKIIVKNLESIKKLAKKEGISINKLINILKKGE